MSLLTRIQTKLILALLPLGCQAQPNGQVPQVSPVTPNEAALFKVDERPLGNFTGTIPVTIPIHTLVCGDISVPVSCNYHMGGIRADELASNIGLGWSLQAGGSITRLMRGIPDDENSPGKGFLYSGTKPSGFVNSITIPMVDLVLRGYLDMEPDIYCYNFNGESGQFYFDESGNVVMKQQTALKVVPVFTTGTISGWIVTDEKGANYYFGSNKNQTALYVDYATLSYASSSNNPNMPNYVPFYTTWHLAEIDDVNGENQVLFTYATSQAQYTSNSGAYGPTDYVNITLCTTEDLATDNIQLTNETQESYLTQIQCRSEYMVFNTSQSRTDYLGGVRLDSLNIYDSSGNLKTAWHLNYGYFYASNAPQGPSPYYQRMKLLNLAAFGPIRTDSIAWAFTYNESVNLPIRNSFAIDYWGYYNGENNNGTLLPNLIYNVQGQTMYTTGKAKREANASYGVANSLTRITWPTGGYRQFTYEGNQALLPSGDQIQPDPAYQANRSFLDGVSNYQGPNIPVVSQPFTVNSYDGSTTFSFSVNKYTLGTYYVNLFLVTTAGDQLLQTYNNLASGSRPLPNGNYRLDAYMSLSTTFSSISGAWSESTLGSGTITRFSLSTLTNNRSIGGMRLKQIDDYDPVTGKTYTTHYSYKLYSADSTLTSGLLVSPVVVASPAGPCGGRNACYYIRLVSNSNFPLATAGGNYVYYTEVRTWQDGNGWTDRLYNYRVDGDSWYYYINQEPLGVMPDYSYARGKLIGENSYNQAGIPVRKTSNTYGLIYYQPAQAYRLKGYYHEPGINSCTDGVLCHACYTAYTLGTGYMALSTTTDSIFGPGGAQVLHSFYIYSTTYGYPQIQSIRNYLNNGQVKTINYRYAFNNPTDFTLPVSAAEQTMRTNLLNSHIFLPLETTTTLTPYGGNPSFVEGTKYSYGYFNGSSLHLATVKQFKTMSDSITGNFVSYDSYGNLTEQFKTGDPHTVWLWGYHHSTPVAKIIGSNYATAFPYVADANLQNPSSDQAVRTEIAKIRTGLPSNLVQITTFTWNPVVGMTSRTDPAGTTVYYQYDNHNRLLLTRDMNNNIIQKFDYHYSGQ